MGPGARLLGPADWPTAPGICPSPPPQYWNHSQVPVMVFTWIPGIRPGTHSCVASTLPTTPSPQSQ